MSPRLYTKVVFTQQIKARLRLKTFFISTVIVVSKSFGFTLIFVAVRSLLPFPIGQRASLVPKVVLMKVLLLQQMTGHNYIYCDERWSDFADDGDDLLV